MHGLDKIAAQDGHAGPHGQQDPGSPAARRDRETAVMGFDLPGLLAARRDQGYELHARHMNPQLPRMLHAIGFDKVYERADGCYLYDRDGDCYLDYLSGFGVFALGRNHPVIRRALGDVLDGGFADMAARPAR
jgi:hypothetical protein